MQKWIGTLHRWAMQLAATLRPLVNHIVDRVEANAPMVRQKASEAWTWAKSNQASRGLMAYDWRGNFWRPLGDWLTNVTWKRFIVVAILALIVGAIFTSMLDSVFMRKELVTVHDDEKKKPGSSSDKDRHVTINTKGVVISDTAAGKTVTVGFDGITVQSGKPKSDGGSEVSAKTVEHPVEVSASGVLITDPETGKRFRIGPQGVVPLDAASEPEASPAPPSTMAASAAKSAKAQGGMPSTPARPATPATPVTPATPHAAASDSIGDVRVKVTENADGSYALEAGSVRMRLSKGVSKQEIAEMMESIRETAQEVADAQREAQREAEQALEEARKAKQEAEQAAERARFELEREMQEMAGKSSKSTRVITVNKPAGFNDAVMPLLTFLLLAGMLAKVILNTRSKAAAKVAQAKMETERETFERQLVEAKLTTMQAQVEPHFLFNTLGSVEYLIEADPKRAAQMQRSLIAYLRAAMPHMRDTTSNMGREAQLIQSYLDILAFRMEERLLFSLDVPSGLYTAEIPPMMLLSLVENSIKHGLEPKPQGGRIDVKAEIADGRLRVTVADTGLGYNPKGAATSGTGVGLANIRERLKVLYKGAAKIDIGANSPEGTRVVIELPYKVASNLKT